MDNAAAFDLKVLIVEDNFAFALQLEMILKELGYAVSGQAESSEEAFEKIRKDQPDLILMDVKIKGKLTGAELGQAIKSLNIPILYISCYKDEEILETAQDSNMIGYLVKPINRISLKSAIQLAISKAYSVKKGEAIEGPIKAERNIVAKDSFFFKKKGVYKKVLTKDISIVNTSDNYCNIITKSGAVFTARMSISKFEEVLPSISFLRVHRQYIIQVDHITAIDVDNNVIIVGDMDVPISRGKRKDLERALNLRN